MRLNRFTPSKKAELSDLICGKNNLIFAGSETSTVFPFSSLDNSSLKNEQINIISLSNLEKKIEVFDDVAIIEGPVTWTDLQKELTAHGKQVMMAPTERLASVLAGISTSANGERSFAYGGIRDQVESVTFLNQNGDEVRLCHSNSVSKIISHEKILTSYANEYSVYSGFKNAPFPRFEKETDLMVGTEGQLGVVISAKIKIMDRENYQYVAIKLPSWRKDFRFHLKAQELISSFRGKIISCELIDSFSLKLIGNEFFDFQEQDLLLLEIVDSHMEEIYEIFSLEGSWLNVDEMKVLSEKEFLKLRSEVPVKVADYISANGLMKKGTDIQIDPSQLADLLDHYQSALSLGVDCLLFGHFGDCHLHFNFLPRKGHMPRCEQYLKQLYKDICILKASPFAEHGIGILKKDFIKSFYSHVQVDMFAFLKNEFDRANKFFPMGYMNIKLEQ